MTSDIYRAAKIPNDQHGDLAYVEAARYADAMLAKGDVGSQAVWKQVIKAIGELQASEPKGTED